MNKKVHALKTHPEFFQAIIQRKKTFEIRKNDTDFKEGEIVMLEEYDPIEKEYTTDAILFVISYILDGGQFGLEEGFCAIGFNQFQIL